MSDFRCAARMLASAVLGVAVIGCNSPTVPPEEQLPLNPGPGFSIAFETNAHTLVPGEVLAIDLLIEREEGFEGAIDLTASDTPGIVVIFRPPTIIHRDDSDLLLVADQGTARQTHLIEFTARSKGHPARTAVLSVTVVDTK